MRKRDQDMDRCATVSELGRMSVNSSHTILKYSWSVQQLFAGVFIYETFTIYESMSVYVSLVPRLSPSLAGRAWERGYVYGRIWSFVLHS